MALNKQPFYDVIIIGSGPSGIAAALTCQHHGLKTVLISPKKKNTHDEIFHGPIESIHPGVEVLLQKLKITSNFKKAVVGSYNFIGNGVDTKSLNPYSSEIWTGFHISKCTFIDFLESEAKQQNLEIIEDTITDIIVNDKRVCGVQTKSGKSVLSHYTIDSSGRKRVLGKRLKFREKYYSPNLIAWTGISTAAQKIEGEKNTALFLHRICEWTWIAQLDSNDYYWTTLALKKNFENCQPKILADAKLNGKISVSNVRWRIFRPVCIEGALMCGDAGAVIDPASGQGIFNAMTSGIEAGDVVFACMANADLERYQLARYDAWFLYDFELKATKLKEYYRMVNIDILEGY
jgi:flavin-dependent dehydrogenase